VGFESIFYFQTTGQRNDEPFCWMPSFVEFLYRFQDNLQGNSKDEVEKNYEYYLESDPMFKNPYALESMMEHFSIEKFGYGNLRDKKEFNKEDFWNALRDYQNRSWSAESVAKGVAFAREDDYVKAMKCYDQALEVDPNCHDAYVARGAAYANQAKYNEALKNFEEALKLDPENKNATRYLSATKNKIEEIEKKAALNTLVEIPESEPQRKRTYSDVDKKLKNLLESDSSIHEHKKRKKDKKEKKHKEKKEKKTKKEKKSKKELKS